MAKATDPLVLVVEDEPAQLELLTYNLQAEGFRLASTQDGEEALILAEELQPDLILLDWMLPNISGIEACRRLKKQKQTRHIPIIMLTARTQEPDKIRGLDTGADDYMVKPYSVNELIARARAVLRRTRPSSIGETLTFEDICLDTERHKVTRAGTSVKLGPKEYSLLVTLMEKPGRVLTREQLLDRVWGRDADVDDRTVDVHIGRLRKALNSPGRVDVVRTIRGTGYSLDSDS